MMAPMKRPLLLILVSWKSNSSCIAKLLMKDHQRDLYEELNADNGWHRTRRTAAQIVLSYGEYGHPFDRYSSVLQPSQTRKLQLETNESSSPLFDSPERYPMKMPTDSPAPHTSQEPSTYFPTAINYDPMLYEPLRIHVDTRRLQSVVDGDPSKYDIVNYLETEAATKAASFWSRHLSTIPVREEIIITPDQCPLAFQGSENNDVHTFNHTDLVFYLFADEGPCDGESPPIAFSDECAMDQFDRPIAGWLLICSEFFSSISSDDNEGMSQRQKLDEVLQHELAHILGMSGSTMAYWRDSLKGGAPRTLRPLAVKEVMCVNGTIINTTMPSEDTVKVGTTISGVRYFEVATPTVRNVVANQFDCENATGARLDHFERFDCIGSHWSSRIFPEETMVSRNMPWEQSITAVTLALFEDTGWYKANFSASPGTLSPPSFGYGAGCAFLTNDCILDDNVPEFGQDTFCKTLTTASPIRCDVSHKRFTKCDLVDYSAYTEDPVYSYLTAPSAPGLEYQYFTNTGLGSFMRFDADYCPTYAAPPYLNFNTSGIAVGPRYIECSGNEAHEDAYDFESYGSSTSRCFNALGAIERPLCLNVECVFTGDLSVIVTVNNGEKVTCESDGQLISLESLNIQIECPRREVICSEFFCPASCSGRGLCRHRKVYGCECFDHFFDSFDENPTCANSPIQQVGPMPTVTLLPSSAPSTSSTTNPTPIPSSFSTYKDETNFPSILAAIVAPTMSNSTFREDVHKNDTSTLYSDSTTAKPFSSRLPTILALPIMTHFLCFFLL